MPMQVSGSVWRPHAYHYEQLGLKQLLPDNIDFIHGPGCPVCVMPKERDRSCCGVSQSTECHFSDIGRYDPCTRLKR